MIVILGTGLSGLSASYHLGHNNCTIFEKNNYIGGHIHSYLNYGFIWDEGPHVSFTKHVYVKELFRKSVNNSFLQFPIETSNYFYGNWIPHPAQSNLYAIPQPLRDKVLTDFLDSRSEQKNSPNNYEEWLLLAFGRAFYYNFPKAYTEKYWASDPKQLTTEWVGERVFYPEVEDVKAGYSGPLDRQTHYITEARYPNAGGYFSFAKNLIQGSNIHLNKEVSRISFQEKKIHFSDGMIHEYETLINTIPLPVLIERSDAPEDIKSNARQLNCSSLLLVNIVANHSTVRKENWIYIYDSDKYSTRINCTENFSPSNGVPGQTGIQVEVYFSRSKPKKDPDEVIARKVCNELIEMGLLKSESDILSMHTRWVPWANVIFDHDRKENLDKIFNWLEQFGLMRETDDLEPMTDWYAKVNESIKFGGLILAGRFGQWKYFWSDDCVLRGYLINQKIN